MSEILDKNEGSFKKYRFTPVLIICSIVLVLSIIAVIFAIFNELTGKGGKGTIGVIVIAPIVFAITAIILFIERKIVTEENKNMVIAFELFLIFIILINVYG